MNKIKIYLYRNRSFVFAALIMALVLTLSDSAFAQGLTPQANPFGTRGDQAIGGFGSNLLTILNAAGFFGGIAMVFVTIYKVATGQSWFAPAMGAVLGLGGWSALGAVAYQMGNNQAFQIPFIT